MRILSTLFLIHSALAVHYVFDSYFGDNCQGTLVTTLAVIADECLPNFNDDTSGVYNCTQEGLVGFESSDCTGTPYFLFGTGCSQDSEDLSTRMRCGSPSALSSDHPYGTISTWRDSSCQESQVSIFHGYLGMSCNISFLTIRWLCFRGRWNLWKHSNPQHGWRRCAGVCVLHKQ